MVDWLLSSENGQLINVIGLALSLLGLFFALWGIKIALEQLEKIATATAASAAAINQVQLKVSSFDTAQECSRAENLIKEIKDDLHARTWQNVIKGYENLIESFLRLAHSNSNIDKADRSALVKHTKDMAKFCEVIRKKLPDPNEGFLLKGQDMALRDFSDIMTKITFSVMKELQR